jgi:hypothetical protein
LKKILALKTNVPKISYIWSRYLKTLKNSLSYIIKMFGANKKNFGVEFCESSHKLLGPSQVES